VRDNSVYYRKRAREEIEAAMAADSTSARKAHLELAQNYADLAEALEKRDAQPAPEPCVECLISRSASSNRAQQLRKTRGLFDRPNTRERGAEASRSVCVSNPQHMLQALVPVSVTLNAFDARSDFAGCHFI
jgi:hypothetical protein